MLCNVSVYLFFICSFVENEMINNSKKKGAERSNSLWLEIGRNMRPLFRSVIRITRFELILQYFILICKFSHSSSIFSRCKYFN